MSSYKEGQVHQLMERFEAEGFTPSDVTRLGQAKILAEIKQLLNGSAKIVRIANPSDFSTFGGWIITEKCGYKQLELEKEEFSLYLSDGQIGDKVTTGDILFRELKDFPVASACVLGELLQNTKCIPQYWKGKKVFFWGTIYRGSLCNRFVRYLYEHGGKWYWNYFWLGDNFGKNDFAVMLVR